MELILYIFLAVLLGIVLILPFFLVRNIVKVKQIKQRIDWLQTQKYTILRIDVPKDNEKMPLSAEQLFASLHGIYSENSLFQNHVSFEIVAKDKYIQFYVYVPIHLKDFVEGQIYAQYPSVEINEVTDYSNDMNREQINFALSELKLTKPDVYPIKTFNDFEVDPLSGITSVMSKLNQGEQVWFQFVVRPIGDEWQEKGNGIVSSVRSGKKPGNQAFFGSFTGGIKKLAKMVLMQAIYPGAEMTEAAGKEVKLPTTVEEALKGIDKKIMKLGFESKVRILCIGNDPMSSKIKCQSVAAAFKQFNTTNLNGFKMGEIKVNDAEAWNQYIERTIEDEGSIFNIEEMASIYHFPHKSVETPNIVWSGSKKGEPPANLPLSENTPSNDLTAIGETNFRNVYKGFGIKKDDRKRHVYIVGKSGTGKSTLIENMAVDDVNEGRGVIVVDPHGELAEKVLSCVPDNRINDVIVFDPADRSFPIAFNLLEAVEDDFKGMVASGFVGIFKKIFGDSWGPRLEHILRNTVLALLDFPNSTMLDIPKMLTDNRFREKVVDKVKDPVIRDFWENEFAQYDSKFRTEAVSPILNKVGQFLATSTIRNIVGQPKSRINIRDIMDQEKIMVVNLSRGKIGEDNSALLGAMMITKIQLAAMSRADVTIDKRSDCFLYVDEFQNFATESFAVILSEARKYNLSLTMANQYIEQMPEQVRSAVFGNAGTLVTFRVGGTDADFLVKEFEPVFSANDLVNLDKYNIYIKLLIDGITSPAFSAKTLPPVQKLSGNFEKIIDSSRKKYASQRDEVEAMIADRSNQEERELIAEAEAFKKGGLEALLVKNKSIESDIEETPKKEEKEEPLENKKEDEPKKEAFHEENSEEKRKPKEERPRIFKYQNIIGNKIFKEQTARGGVKWYVGEDIDREKLKETGVTITPEGEKMIKLAAKVKTGSKSVEEDSVKGNIIKDKLEEGESKSDIKSNIKKETDKTEGQKAAENETQNSDALNEKSEERTLDKEQASDNRDQKSKEPQEEEKSGEQDTKRSEIGNKISEQENIDDRDQKLDIEIQKISDDKSGALDKIEKAEVKESESENELLPNEPVLIATDDVTKGGNDAKELSEGETTDLE